MYSEASGQLTNFDKSGVMFSSNASATLHSSICSSLGVSQANLKAKYLGLPSSWGRSKAETFGSMIEKVLSKMQRAWSSLLKGRELLRNGLRWQIQSGNLAYFWEDKWVPSTKDFKIASHKPPYCTVQKVAEVIDPTHKIWKCEILKEWLLKEDLEAVLAIPIAAVNRDDLLIWHHTPSGVYSVKSGYALAKQICHNSNGSNKPSGSLILGTDFWNSIWDLDVPPKIRHFWWRVFRNLLATKLGLFRHKCASFGECPICRKGDESVEHLLFDCPWTKGVWFGSSLNMRVDPGSITNVTRWTNDLLQGAVLAVILRDSKGNLLDGCAKSCEASSAAQAKAHAIRLAYLMAQALNLSRVEIESDNKSVISLCIFETVPPWEYSAIILDIRGLASPNSISFSWTRRTNNEAAHWVAKACLSKSLPVNWVVCPPATRLHTHF
ncbi:uncharacterized protein LOC114310437 [Camellia sinensis]|uniref:uncharacterized protein LOC114310437 n=1 Tax=Camellia sinensis TaxID=4442 RepID=UPI001036C41C|nr:uncharacterized protein LOC114310437 [Camellia sinensis]